jgi:hypothetical protein
MSVVVSSGVARAGSTILKAALLSTFSAPAVRRTRRIAERTRGIHDESHVVVTPADVLGVARLLQHAHGRARNLEPARLAIDDSDTGLGRDTEEEAVHAAVGRVLLDHTADGLEVPADLPADVHDEVREVSARRVMPERELSDPAEAVDAQGAVDSRFARHVPAPTASRASD